VEIGEASKRKFIELGLAVVLLREREKERVLIPFCGSSCSAVGGKGRRGHGRFRITSWGRPAQEVRRHVDVRDRQVKGGKERGTKMARRKPDRNPSAKEDAE